VGLHAPLIKGYIMDTNIESYLKVYQVLSEEECIKTVNALEEKDKEFQTHQFYNSAENTYHSYEHELSVTYSQIETKDLIMEKIWNTLKKYVEDLDMKGWFVSWNGYSEVRFNRYRTDTQMKLHCDHIHSMFDGQRKGIPTLSILGSLNNDYKGGELVFWGDKVVELKAGEIMIFPSNFLYPHEVKLVTEGTRYSYVSWAW
jgi:predicted 2-oxoglutarate/Fe(II)-dependent dioxygenase YbiX